MPFDKEYEDPKEQRASRVGLKNVSSQPSMFEGVPKKASPQEAQQKVQASQDRVSDHMKRANELAVQFNRTLMDKTLPQNKSIFSSEMERELLQNMMKLADDINNDPAQPDSYGSLSWIAVLLKTCLAQRDRLNQLEYVLVQMEKKFESSALTDFISKEISKVLDKK